MDYLVENGISNETINSLKKKYPQNIIDLLEFNYLNVTEVINYLKSIGITTSNIERLFFVNIDVFFKSLDSLKEKISRFEQDKLAIVLNDNIELFNELL